VKIATVIIFMEINEQSINSLKQLLVGILSPDNTSRKAAESYIKTIECQQGFPLLLLTLINNLNTSVSPHDLSIRQSASVLFKNLVKNRYRF
jgi:exportin-2 (importin alpha re-exporter)